MRYLLIDRIHALEINKRIVAIKNVAFSEDIFNEHFYGFPVMPGALMIESVAQAGTALIEVSTDFKRKAILAIVEKAKFRKQVQPGDQIKIEADILSMTDDSAQMEGVVHLADRIAMDARVTFSLQDFGQIYSPAVRALVENTYNYWLKNAEITGRKPGENHI